MSGVHQHASECCRSADQSVACRGEENFLCEAVPLLAIGEGTTIYHSGSWYRGLFPNSLVFMCFQAGPADLFRWSKTWFSWFPRGMVLGFPCTIMSNGTLARQVQAGIVLRGVFRYIAGLIPMGLYLT